MSLSKQTVEVRDPSPALIAAAYRAFIASTGEITLASTAETPVLLLTNPGGNAVPLASFLRKFACHTAGHVVVFNVYQGPTVTGNGTALTPVNKRLDAAPPATQATAFKSPTVSANGTLLSSCIAGNSDLAVASPLMLNPGQSVLVTAIAQANSDKAVAEIEWGE